MLVEFAIYLRLITSKQTFERIFYVSLNNLVQSEWRVHDNKTKSLRLCLLCFSGAGGKRAYVGDNLFLAGNKINYIIPSYGERIGTQKTLALGYFIVNFTCLLLRLARMRSRSCKLLLFVDRCLPETGKLFVGSKRN